MDKDSENSQNQPGELTAVCEPDQTSADSSGAPGAAAAEDSGGTVKDDEEQLFDQAALPSVKVEHDFLPDANAPGTGCDLAAPATSLIPCPDCNTELEPWQSTCHLCGRIMSQAPAPDLLDWKQDPKLAAESFADWFDHGVAALESGYLSEAQISFTEALARVKGLDKAFELEISVRKQLARVLEKQDKRVEASEQYVRLSQLTRDSRAEFEQRAGQLSRSTVDVLAKVLTGVHYRAPAGKERAVAPLYCSKCRLLLVEAEIFGFRNGKSQTVRCFCGYEGTPLVRVDGNHWNALKDVPSLHSKRSLLLQAASEDFPQGRNRTASIVLSLIFGWWGAQRLYLGEGANGFAFLAFDVILAMILCWEKSNGIVSPIGFLIILPWTVSIFDAIYFSQMSRVTFNLTYNIELVLSRLPMDEPPAESNSEVFSMTAPALADDCVDDFEDGFSTPIEDDAPQAMASVKEDTTESVSHNSA